MVYLRVPAAACILAGYTISAIDRPFNKFGWSSGGWLQDANQNAELSLQLAVYAAAALTGTLAEQQPAMPNCRMR